MKKAEKLSVVVKNQVNNEVTFVLPLADFGKAFDGPAIDPKVLEERQKKLQEDMEKKAEEEREQAGRQQGRRLRRPLRPARLPPASDPSARGRAANENARVISRAFFYGRNVVGGGGS